MKKQILRFSIVGFINTGHYFLWFLFFSELLNLHYLPSHWMAFILSMIGSYIMNSLFTYQTRLSWKKFFQFPAVYVTQVVVSSILLYVFADLLGIEQKLSALLASVWTIPFTFLVSRKILHKNQPI